MPCHSFGDFKSNLDELRMADMAALSGSRFASLVSLGLPVVVGKRAPKGRRTISDCLEKDRDIFASGRGCALTSWDRIEESRASIEADEIF